MASVSRHGALSCCYLLLLLALSAAFLRGTSSGASGLIGNGFEESNEESNGETAHALPATSKEQIEVSPRENLRLFGMDVISRRLLQRHSECKFCPRIVCVPTINVTCAVNPRGIKIPCSCCGARCLGGLSKCVAHSPKGTSSCNF